MPVRKSARGKWFYRKTIRLPDGTRVEITGTPTLNTKLEAERSERAHIQRAFEEFHNPRRKEVPTFHEWFNGRFWNEWVIGGPRGANSPSEQEAKRLIYAKHLRPRFGALALDAIDLGAVNAFRAQLRASKKKDGTRLLSEKTINNILAVLSTPLQYAVKAGILDKAPHVGVAKVERPEIEFIDFEEVARLVRAARADGRPEVLIAVLLAYEAGLRIGEIRALAWSTVDMRARTITIVQQVRTVGLELAEGRVYRDVVGKPKGRRRRVVPMSPALHAALRNRLRVGHVVSAEGGKPVTKEMVRCAMERIAERAGLGDRVSGWHIGRHTFATHLALLGANPWALQEWMGHQRSDETQLYADVARAHGRTIPVEMLAAGASEVDPNRRVLAQLSARLDLKTDAVASPLHRKNKAPGNRLASEGLASDPTGT